MLEILVIIAVVKAFGKKAEEKNLNKTMWKWIGGLSYYVPILFNELFDCSRVGSQWYDYFHYRNSNHGDDDFHQFGHRHPLLCGGLRVFE